MVQNPVPLKRWFVAGFVIMIPLVVTLIILLVVFEFILGIVSPLVTAFAFLLPYEPPMVVIEAATLLILMGSFVLIGFMAEQTPGAHAVELLDGAITSIPGLGPVYTGLRQVSDLITDDGQDQFQEVKLIEFPHQNAYVLGFLTGETPETIEEQVGGGEMVTIMVPLGPNPTSNGFIMHMPTENVYDVELTVEEAIQSITTLGVATESN